MQSAVTTVATWGNSEAVRIPRTLLQAAGLKKGDKVCIEYDSARCLRIYPVPEPAEHRRVSPASQVTFASLFDGYEGGRLQGADAWPEGALEGAERDAWSA